MSDQKSIVRIPHLRVPNGDGTFDIAILAPDYPAARDVEETIAAFDTPSIFLWKPRLELDEDETSNVSLALHHYVDLEILPKEMRAQIREILLKLAVQ